VAPGIGRDYSRGVSRFLIAAWLLATVALAGCATTSYSAGAAAARHGNYAEAITHYQEALAGDPNRLDALVGLGMAQYKLGALDQAIAALEQAVARAPGEPTARLHLGLSYLRKGDVARADEHLTAFVGLQPERRLAAQAQRTLKLIRGKTLFEETREFAAASLEDEAELVQEANEAWRAVEYERLNRWYYPYYPGSFYGPGCYWRSSRLRCF
jgi:tetratricopeptide (TPR) repeat protein